LQLIFGICLIFSENLSEYGAKNQQISASSSCLEVSQTSIYSLKCVKIFYADNSPELCLRKFLKLIL